jgi:putative protease
MNRIELLAPAGSLNILKAAVDSGADAVYCGVNLYNARINADNLTMDDLMEGCVYAHRRSTKVYLTLNTLINDEELPEATELAANAYNLGVDAILVQDIGLARSIKSKYPDIPLHASTQMNVYSTDDYKTLADNGFTRVVLPRELTLDEIRTRVRTAAQYGIDLEVFAHGAVCVCYSGLCLFSSMNKSGTRSGNRGLCAQPCRQEYKLIGSGNVVRSGHLLSPKDRCVIPYLSELISSGIGSLKIEGRMRDEAYVSAAVHAYRVLIDAYYDGILDDELVKSVNDSLLVSFNRGGSFTSQSLGGRKPDNLLSGEFVGKYGLKIGKMSSSDPKKGTITVRTGNSSLIPAKGDYISIRDKKGEVASFPVGKIHEAPGSVTLKGLHPDAIKALGKDLNVFLMSHDFVGSRSSKRKTKINISVDTTKAGSLKADARICDGIFKEVFASVDEVIDTSYEGNPIPWDRIEKQMRKTGDTPFEVNEFFVVKGSQEVGCQISIINDIRRQLIDTLISELDYEASHNAGSNYDMFAEDEDRAPAFAAGKVETLYYFPSFATIKGDLRRDADMYAFSIYDLSFNKFRNKIIDFIRSSDTRLVAVLPDLIHDNTNKRFTDTLRLVKDELGERFYAVIDCDHMSSSDIYSELSLKHFISAGANTYNAETYKAVSAVSDGVFMSYEISADTSYEILSSVSSQDDTVLVHGGGSIPWMQSDFCAVGNNKKDCRMCLERDVFMLDQGEGEKECRLVTRPLDHTSMIYGPSKVNYDDDDVTRLSELGVNIIQCFTEV